MALPFKHEYRWKVYQKHTPGLSIANAAKELSELCDITFSEAVKCIELDFKIDDYDVRDTDRAGYAELLERLIEALEKNSMELLDSQMEDWADENSIH